MKRKILVITERRADFSKFKQILEEISKSKKLEYFLVVTGSHLLQEHGLTINEIKKEKFKISSYFSMYRKNRKDFGSEMTRALGTSIIELSSIIEKLKPDIILAGFDIGANLAGAIVGSHMNILVAHVEGGDVTGTIDESIRHAITNFSHLHFTSNEHATKRLIKMGENPNFIFTVGSPVLDSISKIKPIRISVLEKKYGLNFQEPFVVVLQHTVTTELDNVNENLLKTIKAIKELNIQAIIIRGNADAGSQKMLKILKNSKIIYYPTIPFNEFINILKKSSALIGNSSSGIIEAPFLHIPTINIGTRQQGRIKAESIIDVNYDKIQIKKAIHKILNDKKFLKIVIKCKSLHGNGNSAKKIIKKLKTSSTDIIL